MLSLYCRSQNTLFRFICSVEDLFTLNSNKFRMVHEVDGNPQLDSRDWSMYSNTLKSSRGIINIINQDRPCITVFHNIGCRLYGKNA